MRYESRSTKPSICRPVLIALLAATIAMSGALIGGGPTAGGATKRPDKRGLLLWSSHKPGTGSAPRDDSLTAGFLLQGAQTGPKSKRGSRPLGIIAVLIGLKADHGYGLRLSTARCVSGQGGSGQGGGIFNLGTTELKKTLVGRGIKVTSDADGAAYVNRRYRLTRKAGRRARSVLLLEGDPDRPLVVCGKARFLAGDYNQDGSVDAADF